MATDEEEAAIENAWRETGCLHLIADRLALCRLRNEPPPAWLHQAVLGLADNSHPSAEVKRTRRNAVLWARYVAVWEGHHCEGLTWEEAKVWAAERLRGPAKASAETVWRSYKEVRRVLRAAGRIRDDDDDPGYRLVSDT